METKILKQEDLKEAIELIQKGELVAFPTETVYGLGADCQNETAVKKVYQAKGRPSDNPLIVHVANVAGVEKYVSHLPENFYTLTKAFWPGPLTMIVKVDEGSLPKSVTGGLETCAFRMPDHALTLSFIKESKKELVGPSANTSGKPSPTKAQHVFHDLKGKIAGILDGGTTRVGVESTVVDLSEKNPVILRPGEITAEDLSAALGGQEVIYDKHLVTPTETPKAPGMKYKHYAPNAKVYLMPTNSDIEDFVRAKDHFSKHYKVGIMAEDKIIEAFNQEQTYSLGKTADQLSFSHGLFDALRTLDENCEIILAQTLPESGVGLAYMNRLKKSSGNAWYQED